MLIDILIQGSYWLKIVVLYHIFQVDWLYHYQISMSIQEMMCWIAIDHSSILLIIVYYYYRIELINKNKYRLVIVKIYYYLPWLLNLFYNNKLLLIGYLNDLWLFNTSSLEWTWISGNDTISQPGKYGTKLQSSINNYPGSRSQSTSVIDRNNNIYIFGGNGFDKNNVIGK